MTTGPGRLTQPASLARRTGLILSRQERRRRYHSRDSPAIGSRLRPRGHGLAGAGASSTGGRLGAVVIEDGVPGPAFLPGLLRRDDVPGDAGDLAGIGVEVAGAAQADG